MYHHYHHAKTINNNCCHGVVIKAHYALHGIRSITAQTLLQRRCKQTNRNDATGGMLVDLTYADVNCVHCRGNKRPSSVKWPFSNSGYLSSLYTMSSSAFLIQVSIVDQQTLDLRSSIYFSWPSQFTGKCFPFISPIPDRPVS